MRRRLKRKKLLAKLKRVEERPARNRLTLAQVREELNANTGGNFQQPRLSVIDRRKDRSVANLA